MKAKRIFELVFLAILTLGMGKIALSSLGFALHPLSTWDCVLFLSIFLACLAIILVSWFSWLRHVSRDEEWLL